MVHHSESLNQPRTLKLNDIITSVYNPLRPSGDILIRKSHIFLYFPTYSVQLVSFFFILGLKDSFSLVLMTFLRIFINVPIGCKQLRDHFKEVIPHVIKNNGAD